MAKKIAPSSGPIAPPVGYRAILTIYEADTMSPTDRYKVINWLHGFANDLGHDDHKNLPKTYESRMLK